MILCFSMFQTFTRFTSIKKAKERVKVSEEKKKKVHKNEFRQSMNHQEKAQPDCTNEFLCGMKTMAENVNLVSVRVYQLSCSCCERVNAAFLRQSCPCVWRGRLSLSDNRWIKRPSLSSLSRPQKTYDSYKNTVPKKNVCYHWLLRLSASSQSLPSLKRNQFGTMLDTFHNPSLKHKCTSHVLLPLLPQWAFSSVFPASAFPVIRVAPNNGSVLVPAHKWLKNQIQ